MSKELKNKPLKNILVVNQKVEKCPGLKLCFPVGFFESVEQCKLCKKCI